VPSAYLETHLDMEGIGLADLVRSAWQVLGLKNSLPALDSVVNMPRITIRERIHLIVEALKIYGSTTFTSVLTNRSRLEVVVTFLAMLELIKRNAIQVDQADLFGEIGLSAFGALDENPNDEIEFID
jgi:segregation and condensation protein A